MVGRISVAMFLCVLATPAIADGGGGEDWAGLDRQAAALAATMGKTAAPIDRRIRLARCPEAPQLEIVDTTALAARCPAMGWRLRIALVDVVAVGSHAPSTAILIRRGDPVRLRIEYPSFVLTYSTVAMENGRAGDSIALRAGDRGTLRAAVSAAGEAVLRP